MDTHEIRIIIGTPLDEAETEDLIELTTADLVELEPHEDPAWKARLV